jgi:hypothetical protein
MKDKYRYMIFPDRTYVLTYPFGEVEVSGQAILDMFYRQSYLDKVFDELELSTDEDHIDIGEL